MKMLSSFYKKMLRFFTLQNCFFHERNIIRKLCRLLGVRTNGFEPFSRFLIFRGYVILLNRHCKNCDIRDNQMKERVEKGRIR